MNENETTRPVTDFGGLPRYVCHKTVGAIKIKSLTIHEMPKWKEATCKGSFALGSACRNCERCRWELSDHYDPGSATMTGEDGRQIELRRVFMDKHKPEVGGYYVIYQDGYLSFSPAAAFEEGYNRTIG